MIAVDFVIAIKVETIVVIVLFVGLGVSLSQSQNFGSWPDFMDVMSCERLVTLVIQPERSLLVCLWCFLDSATLSMPFDVHEEFDDKAQCWL